MRTFFLLCMIIVITIVSSQPYAGNHPGTPIAKRYSHGPYSFSGGSGTYCKIQLTITPLFPAQSVLLYATKSNHIPSFDLGVYANLDPRLFNEYDIQNANVGNKQTVQLNNLTNSDTIKIYLVVLNSAASFSYSITVTQTGSVTSLCSIVAKQLPQQQYCMDCVGQPAIGAYCEAQEIYINSGSQAPVIIPSHKYKSYLISQSSNTINIKFSTSQPQVQVFIQFQDDNGQAGLVNYYPDVNARKMITVPNQEYTISIINSGGDISVGVINHGTNSAIFFINYTEVSSSSTNILIIVLAALGGLLLLALIIAGFFVIRRMQSSPQQLIHPRASMNSARVNINQQDALSPREIQIYFPSVPCISAMHPLQNSSVNLQSVPDRDCVICLCPIADTQLMKVTYCRHLFHPHCLVEWFKKQRNCPYCREQYSKSSTLLHYQNLLKESGKNMMAGLELVHQILKYKAKSAVIIEDLKD